MGICQPSQKQGIPQGTQMCSFSAHRTLVEFSESADLITGKKVSEATITKRLIFFHKDLEEFSTK